MVKEVVQPMSNTEADAVAEDASSRFLAERANGRLLGIPFDRFYCMLFGAREHEMSKAKRREATSVLEQILERVDMINGRLLHERKE